MMIGVLKKAGAEPPPPRKPSNHTHRYQDGISMVSVI